MARRALNTVLGNLNAMIAIIRRLMKLVKKEYQFLSRYERSHPHFFWYMGIDAIISISIVLVGFHYLVPSSSPSATVKVSGGSFLSAAALVTQVKSENRAIYWLGPMEGYTYSLDSSRKGVDVISYVPVREKGSVDIQPRLIVETYQDAFTYRNNHLEPLNLNNVKIKTTSGATVQFNEVSLDFAIVTSQGKQEFAVIRYSTWQFPTILMKTANQLELVQ